MVGAAFAGAVVDDSVGNYPFFSNGEPNVKIVVGSGAAISDGVAAANLAAMIGNLAYSDSAVTATGGAGSATGTVAGKTVSLEVTTPAGVSGQQGTTDVKTQLYDFLDVSQVVADMGRANNASTLVGDGVTTGGYKFGNTNYPTIAYKGTVANTGSYTVSEEESYFATAKSYFDTTSKVYTADSGQLTVITNFTDALPYHVDTVNGTVSNRPTNDAYILENRNVKIRFLGEDYVVTDFENSTTTNAITLGKESKFLQMRGGETVTIGGKTLKLVSISPIATTTSTLPAAYFEVSEGTTRLDYFSMDKNTANYNKNGIILDVRDVFVGSGDTSYAEVSVYSASLTLTDGSKITFEGDDATTKLNDDAGWTVSLTFTTTTVGAVAVKSLKTIQVVGRTSSQFGAGQSISLITKPVAKQLTFLGLETGVDQDTLTVTNRGTQSGVYIDVPATGDTSRSGLNLEVNTTEVTSAKDNAFDINNGGKTVKTLYIDEYNGRVYYKDSSRSSGASNWTAVGVEGNVVTYNYPSTKLTNAIQLVTFGERIAPAVQVQMNSSAVWAGSTAADVNVTQWAGLAVGYRDTASGESLLNTTVRADGTKNALVFNLSAATVVPGASWFNVYLLNQTGLINTTLNPFTVNSTGVFTSNGRTADLGGIQLGSTNFSGGIVNTTTMAFTSVPTSNQTRAARSAVLRVYETDTDNSASLNGYLEIPLNSSDASYLFDSSSTTSVLKVPFVSTAAGINTIKTLNGVSFEQGFVTPYGTKLDAVSLSSVTLKYPQRMLKAQFRFGAPSDVNVTSEGSVVTTKPLNEAESYDIGNGYKLKVKTLTGEAVCSGAAGAAACTPSTAAVVKALNPAQDPLVVLDRDAGAGQLIVVGGPMVNTVAASMSGADAVTQMGSSVVKVVDGNKVLVAGYSAADTKDAVNELINWLASKRDEVRNVQ